MYLSRQQSRHKILRLNFLHWDPETWESPTEAEDGGGCDPAARARTPASLSCPSPPLHNVDVSLQLCFDVSSDPQLGSILSSQNRHLSIYMHQGVRKGQGSSPAASLSAAPSSALTLHSATSIQHEETSGNEPPRRKWCHMWLPLFIKLTQARLRCRPFPAFGPAHYSQYLHAILNCWEFPWWQEPPLHEIFRAHRDSREARRRVFTPIWLYDMIFSWAMTVLLN